MKKHQAGLFLTIPTGGAECVATLPLIVATAPAWGPGLCAVGLAAAGGACLAVPMTAGGLAWRVAGWLRGK